MTEIDLDNLHTILSDTAQLMAEDAKKFRLCRIRERELYRGILPWSVAEKYQTKAYWRARLSAWDEIFLPDPTTPESVFALRQELGRIYR